MDFVRPSRGNQAHERASTLAEGVKQSGRNEVMRACSITRAAEPLHMGQSNITARIKKLEQSMATPLLKRHARGVKPTPAGEAACAMAQRLDMIVNDLPFTLGPGGTRPTRRTPSWGDRDRTRQTPPSRRGRLLERMFPR